MLDSIALRKVKLWYDYLSPTGRIDFLEYLWKVDRWKLDYASMSEPLRRFYDPKAIRPSGISHQEDV